MTHVSSPITKTQRENYKFLRFFSILLKVRASTQLTAKPKKERSRNRI